MILRDYQEKTITELRRILIAGKKKPVMVLPTGAGKSVIFGQIINNVVEKGNRVLWLVHRRNLVYQMRDMLSEFDISPGLIMAGNESDTCKQVQLGTIQTYRRRLNLDDITHNSFYIDADIILIDECFSGDTLVSTPMGKKRIDIMRCGDVVFNQFGVGIVESVFSTKAKTDLYLLELENGTKIKCTGDHPFFTTSGWKKVRELDEGENFFSIEGMSLLWQSILPEKEGGFFTENKKDCEGIDIREGVEKAAILLNILCKENGKSNERQSGKTKDERNSKENKTQTLKERGKRAVATFTTIISTTRTWGRVGVGSCVPNKEKKGEWLSDLLQNRYSQQRKNDRDRNRRGITYNDCKEDSRREKDRVACFPRVVNISRIKQKGVTPVFNLRVSGHPSYFANGIAVHNCHRSVSKQYKEIIDLYSDKIVIGCTATPMRADQRGLGEVYDSIVDIIDVKSLTEQEFLSPARYFATTTPDLSDVKIRMGDYAVKDLEKKTNTQKLNGDIVENWLKLGESRKTIVFCVNVKHSIAVCEQFLKNGIDAEHLEARSSDDEREAVFERMEAGRTTVICNVGLYQEGLDVPDVSCIVMARPTKSLGLWRQCAGRGLRISKSFDDCLILDHGGVIEENGFLDEKIHWALDGKKRAYKKPAEKKEKKKAKCPQCNLVLEQTDTCPDCGSKLKTFGKKIETTNDELKELKANKKATIADKRRYLGMLKKWVREKGYNPRMVNAKYRSMYGVWVHSSIKDIEEITPDKAFLNRMTYDFIKYAKRKINEC